MYVRSHIDTVFGYRKYIYIDEENKKYIKNKNSYYPIKKYKGVYSLLKKRGGAGGIIDNVHLYVYGIKSDISQKVFNVKIDMENIVLNPSDDTYKIIISDNIIHIFNKYFDIKATLTTMYAPLDNLNHFIIIINNGNIKVFLRNLAQDFKIEDYTSFYNIIYSRNNKIDKYSDTSADKMFLTIFSISDDDNIQIRNKEYLNIDNNEYNMLYTTVFNKLKEIYTE